MPLIYKPYQATLANKEGQKLYYPRLVKFGKMVNTQKMAELIAEKASLTAGDVHNVIRNLMSVMREQLLNSRTVRLEGLGTFTMIAKAGGKGVELESKVSSSQITSLRCQFTPEYTRAANGSATRALTTGVEFVHIKDVAVRLWPTMSLTKTRMTATNPVAEEEKRRTRPLDRKCSWQLNP